MDKGRPGLQDIAARGLDAAQDPQRIQDNAPVGEPVWGGVDPPPSPPFPNEFLDFETDKWQNGLVI